MKQRTYLFPIGVILSLASCEEYYTPALEEVYKTNACNAPELFEKPGCQIYIGYCKDEPPIFWETNYI